MGSFCLLPEKVDEFKQSFKNGKINIGNLIEMAPEERLKLFNEYAGKDAVEMNKLFEQKLILKDRVRGLENWFNKSTSSGKWSPERITEAKRLMTEYKNAQRERVFSPKENESFLNSLADIKVGTHVTKEQAKKIFDMTVRQEELLKNHNLETGKWTSDKDALEYGLAKADAEQYVDSLKYPDKSVKQILKTKLDEFKLTSSQHNALKAAYNLGVDALRTTSDTLVATLASIDNSFMGRQGIKTLFTEPQRAIRAKMKGIPYKSVWWNMARNSFSDFAKVVGGKDAERLWKAHLYSKPRYINGEYRTAGIISKTEEQFPTSLPERVPVAGRAFKASSVAFGNSAERARVGIYDFLSDMAEKNGVKLDKTQIEDFGRLTNSLTARGQWGKRGDSGLVRLVLWAPKMLKANLDTLTAHGLGVGLETSAARKQAAMDTLSVVGSIATLMTLANAIKPGSAETDPRSSDFGKIKIGNTRFDLTGGMASLVTLAARLSTGITNVVGLTDVGNTKSATTGVVSKYGTKVGDTSAWDALIDFLENKTTPGARIVVDMLKGETFNKEKPTLANEFPIPISIKNIGQQVAEKDYSPQRIIASIADVFGVSTSTYTTKSSWAQTTDKTLTQFKEKVGQAKFDQANKTFDDKYNKWLENVQKDPKWKTKTDDEQKDNIQWEKDKLKKDIFKQYNFKYKPAKKEKTDTSLLKSLNQIK